MPREKSIWKKDKFHHVTTRGNNKQVIFRNREDYQAFFRILTEAWERAPFTIAAYCIMPNHYHLLIRPDTAPLSYTMSFINTPYSRHFRKKYGYVGRVYQKRYFSKAIDGNHGLSIVSRYIHRNPIDGAAPLAAAMEEYAHSSFKHFANPELSAPLFLKTNEVISVLPPGYQKNSQGYMQFCQRTFRDKRLNQWIETSEIE
ncbi:transposase [Indiicoccus explosivorum]|uniref:transposase n=1 Tax=Indiicoccus explosivorum TaxID=1917864 RepID=UPI00138FCFFD|nr:transposase [Indiicoccus explosivorum]